MVIKIDRKKCTSCSLCVTLAPKTFEMDQDFISKVKDKEPYDTPSKIKEAVSSCPSQAIKIVK